MRIGRQILNASVFLVGLLGTSWVYRATTPHYNGDYLGPKAEHVRTAESPYDVVFFGSSMVARGVQPSIVDSELEALGVPGISSFNAAAPGAFALQVDRPMHLALSRAEPPRIVVVEIERLRPEVREKNYRSKRLIAAHDFHAICLILPSLLRYEAPWLDRLSWVGQRLEHFGLNYFRVGGYREVLADGPVGRGWEERTLQRSIANSGFESFETSRSRQRPNAWARGLGARAKSFAESDRWEVKLANRDDAEARARDVRAGQGMGPRALRIRYERLKARGVRPVFVIMPQFACPLVLDEAIEAELPDLINLNDPKRFPELFARESRFDLGHLNARGSELASRILAGELAAMLRRD